MARHEAEMAASVLCAMIVPTATVLGYFLGGAPLAARGAGLGVAAAAVSVLASVPALGWLRTITGDGAFGAAFLLLLAFLALVGGTLAGGLGAMLAPCGGARARAKGHSTLTNERRPRKGKTHSGDR